MVVRMARRIQRWRPILSFRISAVSLGAVPLVDARPLLWIDPIEAQLALPEGPDAANDDDDNGKRNHDPPDQDSRSAHSTAGLAGSVVRALSRLPDRGRRPRTSNGRCRLCR